MKYNLQSMLNTQAELNKTIYKTQNLEFQEICQQSHLCIIVEIMELCNETRCFNYWSKKKRNNDDIILEEFADVLCFLLTEILQTSIQEVEIDDYISIATPLELTQRFQELVRLFCNLDINNVETYQTMLNHFFNLGYALGYNVNQIYEAYQKKVAKNYEVQATFINN